MNDRPAQLAKQIPAQEIPVPEHLSPQAQACLATPLVADTPYPDLVDTNGWRRRIAAMEADILPVMLRSAGDCPVQVDEHDAGGVRCFAITPEGVASSSRGVVLDIHGGALVIGGGEACRSTGSQLAQRLGLRVWAVDYRMPPDHPYPAPLDDCLVGFRALLDLIDPAEIVVSGLSAGGNLAAALILRARDEGLPLPAGAILMTPEIDLTESGDSFATNRYLDTVPPTLMPVNLLYAAGHDLRDPYLSPLFGDFTKGFPPTILTTGTRDLFLSNTVRLHRALRAAAIPADLHVLEAAGHVQFPGSPEAAEIDREIRTFIQRVLSTSGG